MDRTRREELPFRIGQLVESRSFLVGFRGSWFRCKIKDIAWRKGQLSHALEFLDFPDEKLHWTRVFQIPPHYAGQSKVNKRELMVRPLFPPVCPKNRVPDVNTISEMIVIVEDTWKVGDLVDWLTDGCYWSAKVNQILGDEKVQIELPPPPIGEGLTYEAFCKDLRPTLDWSPESGWMLPVRENENVRQCAQLIKPINQGILQDSRTHNMERKSFQVPTQKPPNSFSSLVPASSSEPTNKSRRGAKRSFGDMASKEVETSKSNLDVAKGGSKKTSLSDSVSSPNDARNASTGITGTSTGIDKCDEVLSSKEMRTDIPLNITSSDTLEAAVLDLEELVVRVKWLKGVLECGLSPPTSKGPPWKFLEHRASALPK